MHNFRTAIHCDHDEGSALALGLFLEKHQPSCTWGPHLSCHKNWYFLFPELHCKIPLWHGVVIIWDSERCKHGTICDGFVEGGCRSDVYACESQLKQSHYHKCDIVN
jgi:hypothetical protein